MSARKRNKKAKGRYIPDPAIDTQLAIEEKEADADANTVFTDPAELAKQAGEVVESEELVEEVVDEKYYDDAPVSPLSGATSFEEADAVRAAAEKARQVRSVIYDAELISSNILTAPIEPSEKATKLKSLADAFASRVTTSVAKDTKEFDYELAEAQMLVRQSGATLADKAVDIFERAKKDAEPYPIHDASHVRNSLARVANAIKAGGDEAVEARKAWPAIRAAARKLGIGAPSQKNANSLVVFKDKTGNYRWFGWVSNNFKDRDGQIITDEAHKEYVGWLDKNPQYAPTFRIWHTKGTDREKQADFWNYEHGFLMMSGPLTEKEAIALMGVAAKEKLGMSHGFYGTVKDEKYITWYRSFEVSDLPSTKASNPWTPISVIEKEIQMDKLKADYIGAQLGDDFVKTVEDEAQAAQADLRKSGVEEKEVKDETKVESKDETATPELAEVMKAVGEQFGMPELSAWVKQANEAIAKVPELEAKIAELGKSTDQKVAEAITPPAQKQLYAWMNRESDNPDNKVDDEKDKDLVDGVKEGTNWFSQVNSGQPSLVA